MTDEATNTGAWSRAPGSSLGARDAVTHRRLQSNGIGMHLAEAGSGPLVVLLHGFPELWYSWRHQLPVLAAAGYHAVAPDLRGYGDSDASVADEGYAPSNLAADVVGLLDALGAEEAVLVGHDWGANIAWACAERFPQRVAALVALSVPYRPRPPMPPSEMLRQFVPGDAPVSPYPLGVTEEELAADPGRSLRRFLYALSGDAPADLVPRLFQQRAPSGRVLDSMPEPEVLPGWLGEADLEEYARAYARTGFRGPLGVYRNQDRDWHEHPEIGTAGVRQPALFIGGRRDPAVLLGSLSRWRRRCRTCAGSSCCPAVATGPSRSAPETSTTSCWTSCGASSAREGRPRPPGVHPHPRTPQAVAAGEEATPERRYPAMAAQDLTCWTQALLLDGALARAEPKTLRSRLLHVAARPHPLPCPPPHPAAASHLARGARACPRVHSAAGPAAALLTPPSNADGLPPRTGHATLPANLPRCPRGSHRSTGSPPDSSQDAAYTTRQPPQATTTTPSRKAEASLGFS
jgi:pimeloyl-ACP methyl ester carboxylesterase